MRAVSQGGPDLGAGVQSSQDGDRGDGGPRKFGCYVMADRGEAQYIDVQHLAAIPDSLEVITTVVAETEIEGFPSDRLADDVGMAVELVANGGADEVGPVCVETVAAP